MVIIKLTTKEGVARAMHTYCIWELCSIGLLMWSNAPYNKVKLLHDVVQAGMKYFSSADIQFASTVVEISAYEKNTNMKSLVIQTSSILSTLGISNC